MKNETPPERAETEGSEGALEYLERAADSIGAIRTQLDVRRSIEKSIRAAMRCLIDAQDVLDREGPTTGAMLELVSAGLWAGRAEEEMRRWANGETAEANRRFDLRAYPRVDVTRPIRLEPELVLSNAHHLQAPIRGETVNLSRGGVLARVDQGILQRGRYRVLFLDGKGRENGSSSWGTVRRSRFVDAGWEVGIEFEDPLDDLQMGDGDRDD